MRHGSVFRSIVYGAPVADEYFTFPEKFFFVDLTGLETLWPTGFDKSVEFVFCWETSKAMSEGNGSNLNSRRKRFV